MWPPTTHSLAAWLRRPARSPRHAVLAHPLSHHLSFIQLRSILRARNEKGRAVVGCRLCRGLGRGQHDWHARCALGPHCALHSRQSLRLHSPAQEQQCRQRLVLRAERRPVALRQPTEKPLHFLTARVAQVTPAVAADLQTNPVQVRLLAAQTVVFQLQSAASLVHQPRPLDSGGRNEYCCRLGGILRRGGSWPDSATTISSRMIDEHHHNFLFPKRKFWLTIPLLKSQNLCYAPP